MSDHVRLFLSTLLALGATTLFLASCTSTDEATLPTRPFVRNGVPLLPVPTLRVAPDFASRDSLARHARGLVVGQFNRVRLASKTAETISATLNTGVWGMEVAGCRTRVIGEHSDSTCTYRILSCATAAGFDWMQVVDGPCIPDPDEPPLVSWVRFAGSTNPDGSIGTMETFVNRTTQVEESFTWEMDADRTVRQWSFYDGPATEANLEGRLRWDESDPDRAHGEFLWDGDHRWEAEVLASGREGTMTLVERVRADDTWVRREEVSWKPAHGTWSFFDSDGVLVEERIW